MKRHRILALILTVVITLVLFAGCGGTGEKETTETSATSAPAATTEKKLDLEGYELIIRSPWVTEWQPDTATSLGNELNEKYESIQQEYNFTLKLDTLEDSYEPLMAEILSNKYTADIYDIKTDKSLPLGMKGLLVDWASERMKDFGIDVNDETLFNIYLSKLSVIGDKQYGLQVASQYYLPQFGYGIMFNKSLAASKGVTADSLYQSVRDGKWNFSAYLDLADKLSSDTNGDGVVDIYSAGGGNNPYGAEVYLAGGAPFTFRDGKWVYTLNEAKSIDGLEFMQEVFYKSRTRFTGGAGTSREMFRDGTCAMLWAAGFYLSNDVIKSCTFDFGLLPMPKGNKMDHYVDVISTPRILTMMSANVNPKAVDAFKLWCSVMNNEQGWKDYMLNEALRGDQQAFEMVTEYIMPNTVLNTSSLSGESGKIFDDELFPKIRTGEMTPSQAAESQKDVLQGIIDKQFGQ